MECTVVIGCSGYFYWKWKGKFYPSNLKPSEWLKYYAKHFNGVEINSSFYRLPARSRLRRWYQETPDTFHFVMKGPRSFTHYGKEDALQAFYEKIEVLEEKLAGILLQFPPSRRYMKDWWENLLEKLSDAYLHGVEFRHASWFEALDRNDITFPAHVFPVSVSAPSSAGLPERLYTVHEKGYIRFHGKLRWYRYNYDERELLPWVESVRRATLTHLFVFFNNDVDAHAPENAHLFFRLYSESYL